ncbi:hypothetical protein CMO91_04535 [Candidatus Woesearchaeota archaeon]|jgi:sugar-specific transcriptional regulator TrmB|nr:hypothetical protein [Candidatus Woesearchaeota archaeon]
MDAGVLENIGLTKNEVKVYLALLDLGETTTTPLVKKAIIPPSKVYPALDRLIQKGLVSYIVKQNRKQFTATDPRNIIEYLNKKETDLERQKESVEGLIPQFLLKQKMREQPAEAQVYEGKEGIRTIFQNLFRELKKGGEYYVFYSANIEEYQEWKLFFRNIHIKREKLGLTVKIIHDESLRSIAMDIKKGLRKYNVRFFKDPMPSSWTMIYNDKVLIATLSPQTIGFVIHSKAIADPYKAFFQSMWKRAKA